MPEPTPKAIAQFIERLVRGKLEDGQLSECPLTLQNIDDICDAFSSVLRGVFHERIEYPEVKRHVPAQAGTFETSPVSAVKQTASSGIPVKPTENIAADNRQTPQIPDSKQEHSAIEARQTEQSVSESKQEEIATDIQQERAEDKNE